MQFNDTSTNKGIIQMCEATTNLGLTAISGTPAQLAYFTNLINMWYQVVAQYIWLVNKNWQFDDSNYTTNFPVAYTTVVNNQRDYVLPSSLRRVTQVECMDSSGKYFSLIPMSPRDATLLNEKWQDTAGTPREYYMLGRSIILYPKPDTSVLTAVAGLRVSFEKKLDLFATTDTTQEPGFDEEYHPILYYGPCFEWATVNNVTNISQLCEKMIGRFDGLLNLAQKHYSDNDANILPAITRGKTNFK